MKTRFLILCILIAFEGNAFAQKDITVGDRAPELVITDYIQNVPLDKSFRNKYILLEFWATWCAPCLGAVPHLNELKDKYKNREDILVLSMTYEEPEKVKKTLARVKFKTAVVSDQTQKTLQNFGVESKGSITVPRTVLIDNKGIIKWIGNPNNLTDSIFDRFVNGMNLIQEKKQLNDKSEAKILTENVVTDLQDIANRLVTDKQTKYSFSLLETEKKQKVKWSKKFPLRGIYIDVNNNCRSILSDLMSVSETQIIIVDSLKDRKYSLFYKNDNFKDEKKYIEDIKANLIKALNLKERIEVKFSDVYILTLIDKNKLNISTDKSGNSHSGSNDNQYTFSNTKIEYVLKNLSLNYEIIINDRSKLTDNYDFIIKKGSVNMLIEELESYGLQLKKAIEKTTFYIYE
ncbi:MAG TPA: TlpA disulfide reductase family protein [Paludibacter sp.]|nr:TlpA disulfide reductase family protein [Paludibacter sp.]